MRFFLRTFRTINLNFSDIFSEDPLSYKRGFSDIFSEDPLSYKSGFLKKILFENSLNCKREFINKRGTLLDFL